MLGRVDELGRAYVFLASDAWFFVDRQVIYLEGGHVRHAVQAEPLTRSHAWQPSAGVTG